jgi:hypothetical protein
MSRGPKITPAVATRICDSIAGGESLVVAAGKVGVDEKTIRRRVASDPAFREQYRTARAFWAEHVADETMALADGAVAEAIAAPEGTANAVVQALKLKVNTRQWLLARLAPHLLGDRIEHVGAGGDPLIPAEIDNGKIALAICNLIEASRPKVERPIVDVTPAPVEEAALPSAPAPPRAAETILDAVPYSTDRKVIALQQRDRPRELPSNYFRGRT